MRQSGVLMHISSLPGPDGIGSLGQEAFDFADFLHDSGMHIWQVLPMGPTGYGESPYQSTSVFAGNPMLISLQRLHEEGLLTHMEDEAFHPGPLNKVDFASVKAHKEKLLRRCFFQSEDKLKHEIASFAHHHPWVKDFAMFTAVKEHFNGDMWQKWPEKDIRLHKAAGIERWKMELMEDIRYHVFCQYLFDKQWKAFKQYCNSLGILLFGDMPIYVAEDSADTWTHPKVFQLDKNRVPKRVAGVPPDYFSEDGQLWGNPLYRWHKLRRHGFDWWIERMRHMTEMYDIVRVDHFIGFANYYSIPYGAVNARHGKWVKAPGKSLFKALNRSIPNMKIVAEDLGAVNHRVRKLISYTGFPGMRVLEFAFGGDDSNMHQPANYTTNCVAYTGTHDNNTILGWAKSTDEKSLNQAREALGFQSVEDAPAAFVKAVLECKADTAILAMQDILGLDGDACMNHPGTIGGNWMWRMLPGQTTAELAHRLYKLNQSARRLPE